MAVESNGVSFNNASGELNGLTLTASAWGSPPQRLYRFLHRAAQQVKRRPPRLIVIGCADGKFVLPAARQGWKVVAIDVDANMIDGCPALPSQGIPYPVAGLRTRLKCEGLTAAVDVRLADYMTDLTIPVGDALWTSGALQYSFNSSYSIQEMTNRLRHMLVVGGLAYIEYMIPDEPKLKGRPNCPPVSWWRNAFPHLGWRVLKHSVAFSVSDLPHPYTPTPHVHSWGRLLAQRIL